MSALRRTILAGLLFFGPFHPARPQGEQPQPGVTTITLHLKDVPLRAVLGKIGADTGYSVESQLGDDDPKISVDFERVSFWKAVDIIAEKADAVVSILPRDGRILLAKRTSGRRPILSYSGPFRFCVKGVTASWDVDTDTRKYAAVIEVAWEPGLKPLFLESIPQDVVAFDDKGHKVPGPSPGTSKAPVDGRTAIRLENVPLPEMPRSATALARIEGRLEAIAPVKMVKFQFPTLNRMQGESSATIEQDGATCRVERVAISPNRWTVRVAIQNPPGGADLESYQMWDLNNVLALVSKDGKTRLVPNAYSRDMQSRRASVISYHFTDRAKLAQMKPSEWTVEYQTPGLIVNVPMTFSFKDVPLP